MDIVSRGDVYPGTPPVPVSMSACVCPQPKTTSLFTEKEGFDPLLILQLRYLQCLFPRFDLLVRAHSSTRLLLRLLQHVRAGFGVSNVSDVTLVEPQ